MKNGIPALTKDSMKWPALTRFAIPRMWFPILGLALVSILALGLLAMKLLLTGRWHGLYLGWNLFLAWVPLICALVLHENLRQGCFNRWRLGLTSGLWFLFFPNAPYIVTDLIHLHGRQGAHYWVDLILISLFAVTGLVAGFISLHLIHQAVQKYAGWMVGWGFVVAMAGLTGLGVYMGRFLRWNSWDLLVSPWSLARDTAGHFLGTWPHPLALVFPLLFALFLLACYTMFYALTFLPQDHQVAEFSLKGFSPSFSASKNASEKGPSVENHGHSVEN